MRIFLMFICFSISFVYSQSKKEQIEILQQRFDSLQVVQNKLIVDGTKTQKEFDAYKTLSVKRLDSLNTLRVAELKRNESLTAQLNESNARVQKNDQEIRELKRSLEESETSINTLTHRVALLLDSVTMYKKALDKAVTIRDLSDGKFSENELDFIIENLKTQVLNYTEEDLGAEVEFNQEEIIIHLEGESEIGPICYLQRNIPIWVAGDLDHDGTNEIIFDVFFTAGVSAYWSELYCLKLSVNGNYVFIRLEPPCPCKNNLDCQVSPTKILGFSNNVITINAPCFGPNDPRCCPSSTLKAKYKFLNNKLILVN